MWCLNWIGKKSFQLLLTIGTLSAFAQPGQINITRVQQMPNIPSPYLMRNWKDVAIKYDQLIFSTTSTGQYLPLMSSKPSGINYPQVSPVLLQTYVGTNLTNQAEAINILPAIVGASLMDIDKSNQSGINWVIKTKDFFNKANSQNVYLNGYSTTSGGDWWYDVMPNVFFYQLYSKYPTQTDFQLQFKAVADRWLDAVRTMGGTTTPWTAAQMNYHAWNLTTMTGQTSGVKEPEAAGGIGWLLYHAYLTTGEKKYLEGAQMSIEFLSGLTSNPAYELQLPYGTFIAAKMNAELGTTYNIPKMINWCFDRGPLRGWGAIVGNWNGADVHGLIGEANDTGTDYAFVMNGFQQASALVPLIKYDKRFARGIAKWVLNLANASRLFYSQYLPPTSQDDFTWSSTYDPQSVIAYEALKEKNNFDNNKPLYGTGDAKRNSWAQTNLSLYSSSSVGYLAAVLEPTDVAGILLLDVNKTDFFSSASNPSYVLYNPHAIDKQVTLTMPSGSYDIYDAISETIIALNVSGSTSVTVKADEALLLVYIPAGIAPVSKDGKFYLGTEVIDYHYGYNFLGSPRIKSLAVADTLVELSQQVHVFTTVENIAAGATYKWSDSGGVIGTFATPEFTWSVPHTTGPNLLKLEIDSNGKILSGSILFNVVDKIPQPPVINSISSDKVWYAIGNSTALTCNATDDQPLAGLTYHWIIPSGSITSQTGTTLTWQPPAVEGLYEITCEVKDQDNLIATKKKLILVKPISSGVTPAFAYFPLDGNADDYSGNHRDAKKAGVDATNDARGEAGKAYLFDSGSDIILMDNSDALNFQNKITLSFWVKLESLNEETFILSHGSWEERWKVSVTPDSRLRWTVKTANGTKDLDSSFPLILNHFYHFAVVYSGYSMELYADGELEVFSANTGLLNITSKSLTFGRKQEGVTSYSLRGVIDEVRIYNESLPPDEIKTLKSTWNIITGIDDAAEKIIVYPNPADKDFYIATTATSMINSIDIFDSNGRAINSKIENSGAEWHVKLENQSAGILILKVKTAQGVYHSKLVIN
jgi:hypothetical protein